MSSSYLCFGLCLFETTSTNLQWESPNTYALILIVAIIHDPEHIKIKCKTTIVV